MSDIIHVAGLRKSFGDRPVIRDCNFTAKKNEVLAFLGPNGSGKTTIFKLLLGLLKKDGGSINVLGLDVDENLGIILKKMGVSIETPVFYEHLSAQENLNIHLTYMDAHGSVKDTLDTVGLHGVDNKPVSKFSVGMRARLAIARAVIHDPSLIILDEPLNGLDPQGIRDMRVFLKNLTKDQGKTILISSHTLSEIEYIADSVAVLSDGIVRDQSKMSHIQQNYPGGLEDYYFHKTGGKKNV